MSKLFEIMAREDERERLQGAVIGAAEALADLFPAKDEDFDGDAWDAALSSLMLAVDAMRKHHSG